MSGLTLIDKFNILTYISDGIPTESISQLCGITVDTVKSIEQNRHAIIEVYKYCLKCHHWPLKSGHFPHMENILFCWFEEQTKVTNKVLSDKAKEIIEILNESPTFGNATNFTGSTAWRNGFKCRYGIPVPRRKSKALSINNRDEISVTEPEELQVQDIPTLMFLDGLGIDTGDDGNVSENGSNEDASIAYDDQIGDAHTQAESDGIQISFVQGGVINTKVRNNEAEQMNPETLTDANLDLDGDDGDDGDLPIVIDLTDEIYLPKKDDIVGTLNNEDLTEHFKPKTRKRPTLITDDHSSEDFSDSESSNAHKRKRMTSERVLVPTRKNSIKFMSLQDYKQDSVIRIFKPVLKYAKDMGWSNEDSDVLEKLYQKSLKSCAGKAKQSTITEFFRKKK